MAVLLPGTPMSSIMSLLIPDVRLRAATYWLCLRIANVNGMKLSTARKDVRSHFEYDGRTLSFVVDEPMDFIVPWQGVGLVHAWTRQIGGQRVLEFGQFNAMPGLQPIHRVEVQRLIQDMT